MPRKSHFIIQYYLYLATLFKYLIPFLEYTDIDYLDGEYDTYEDEVEVEEKLNKLLKNMQPEMPDGR